MTQDNLTSRCCDCGYEWRTGQHGGHSCTEHFVKTIDTLTKQVESQDEIADALHIVNAELGRRVESQKEEIRKYCELIYQVASKFPDESRHETALRYIKMAEEPSTCCSGEDQLPKEE